MSVFILLCLIVGGGIKSQIFEKKQSSNSCNEDIGKPSYLL